MSDLGDIWDYIATDSIESADRWIAKLFDAFREIARMPGIGHRGEDLTGYAVLFWAVEVGSPSAPVVKRYGRSDGRACQFDGKSRFGAAG